MVDTTAFEAWLSKRFQELNTDESVFVPYITSILEGDESQEEKMDAVDGILQELAEAAGDLNVEAFRAEILSRWAEVLIDGASALGACGGDASLELDSKLDKLLKLNDDLINSSAKQEDEKGNKNFINPDKALRAKILNQCQDSSADESDGEGPSASCSTAGGAGKSSGGGGGLGVERNTNAERVQSELKDKRERDKEEAAKKREKDREDRAKQKQSQQERKDRAKKRSAKVERKR